MRALTGSEIVAVLGAPVPTRVATVDADGLPHGAPLGFVWQDGAFWMSSVAGQTSRSTPLPEPQLINALKAAASLEVLDWPAPSAAAVSSCAPRRQGVEQWAQRHMVALDPSTRRPVDAAASNRHYRRGTSRRDGATL